MVALTDPLPFHAGELQAQDKAGTRGVAMELSMGKSKSLSFDRAHDEFLKSQQFAVISSVQQDESVWVSPLFASPQDAPMMEALSETWIDIRCDALPDDDILNLAPPSAPLSILGIDLLKRTRHRIGGHVLEAGEDDTRRRRLLHFGVDEYSPNCPKYINRRELIVPSDNNPTMNAQAHRRAGIRLETTDVKMLQTADTLFLGTHAPGTGADVNHRGGKPGFIRVLSKTTIEWPEYRGNGMFFSSGNLEVNNRAGVTVVDFESGDVLQMTGTAVVDWNHNGSLDGATRAIQFEIQKVVRVTAATNLRWKLLDYSPYNPAPTGTNNNESSSSSSGDTVTLAKIVQESPLVKTFRWVAPRNIAFLPGQYGTFEFGRIPGSTEPSHVRTWTLSETPNSIQGDNTLDISVKRKPGGLLSNWLHDHAQLGMTVQLHGVQGELTPIRIVDEKPVAPKHLLLISAGIGITPNLAIVRGLGAFELQSRTHVTMIHVERTSTDLAFQGELSRRASQYPHFSLTNILSSQQGRLTQTDLERLVPASTRKEQVVYLCGPDGFMSAVTQHLVQIGVPAGNIHTEAFDF